MTANKVYTAIGLMSGTSLDGVDAALIETDGEDYIKPLAFLSVPYNDVDRKVIRAAFGVKDRGHEAVKKAEGIVTKNHAQVVKALLRQAGVKPEDVDIIGFHGQTI